MSSLGSYEKFRRELKQLLSEGDNLTEGDECLFELVENLDNPKTVLEFARNLKTEGNSSFKAGNIDEALEKYGYAGIALVRYNFEKEEDKVESLDLAICILLNLTACLSKNREFAHVGQICSLILDYRPNNVKALFRRAKAASGLGKIEWAYWDLMVAIEIEPNNREVRKELEEIKGILYNKDKLRKDGTNEAPVGLGLCLPSKKKKSVRELEQGHEHEQGHGQAHNFESSHEKDDKSAKKQCIHKYGLKEEECGKSMGDVSEQNPTGNNESSDCDMQLEVYNVNEESHDVRKFEDSSSTDESCVIEVTTNPINERDLKLAEPKCRFYNRRRQGSVLTITKKDYLSMTKGKTIVCGNAKMGAYMQVRVVNQKPYEKSSTVSESWVEKPGEQINTHSIMDVIEEVQDISESMEMVSDFNPCMTSEKNPSTLVEAKYPIDDESSSSNPTMAPWFQFSANKAPRARLKRIYAKCSNSIKSNMLRPQLNEKNKRARKIHADNSCSCSPTNNVCVCRFKVGKKRKHVLPPLMNLYHPPRKKSTSCVYGWSSVKCVCCLNSKDVVYGSIEDSVCSYSNVVNCGSYEMAHGQSSRK